jgi:hypothetical protein
MEDQTPHTVEQAPQTERSATQARQAVTGHNVRYVLFFGIVGAIVALAAILAVAT